MTARDDATTDEKSSEFTAAAENKYEIQQQSSQDKRQKYRTEPLPEPEPQIQTNLLYHP